VAYNKFPPISSETNRVPVELGLNSSAANAPAAEPEVAANSPIAVPFTLVRAEVPVLDMILSKPLK